MKNLLTLLLLTIATFSFGQREFKDQSLILNNGTDRDVTVEFNLGLGANNPKYRYNHTSDVWEFTHDGSTWQTAVGLGYVNSGLALKAPLASPAFTGVPTAPTPAQNDGSTKIATTSYVDTAVSNATIPDATNVLKGKIQLAGDLAGTAAAPTVPALTLKANIASPTFTGTPSAPTAAQGAGSNQLATTLYVDTAAANVTVPDATAATKGKIQLAGDLGGTAASPTVPGLATKQNTLVNSSGLAAALSDETGSGNAVFATSPALSGTPTAPTATAGTNTTQIATTQFVTSAVSSATPADATTTSKGIVQLAGDLAGTATAPTVPGLATKANDASVVHLTGNESISGTKTYTGKTVASSTSNGFHPCPSMTAVQIAAIASPSAGDCVFNTDTNQQNTYNASTTSWVPSGAAVKGLGQTTTQYPSLLRVPNNLATDLGSGETLLENGNNNLLANPSFEHATFNTGWTCTGVTPTVETSVVAPGSKKAMKLTLSSSTGECYQDSTIGASQASGVQFLAMARLKAALTAGTIKLCARQVGVTSTTLCNSNVDDTFNPRKMPFVGSNTSNGVSIVFTGATGTAYIDDAFVGPVDLKQDVSQARLLGVVKVTGCASYWTASGTSYTAYGAQTGCVYTTEGAALAPTTNIPGIRFSQLDPGDYVIEYNGEAGSNGVNDQVFYQFWDGTNVTRENDAPYSNSTYNGTSLLRQSISYSSPQSNVTLQLRMKSTTASSRVGGTNTMPGVFKLWYFPKGGSVYSSTGLNNADRIGEVIFSTNPTAPQGFISALNVSIGQAGSGATYASDSYYALYEHLWNTAGLSTTAGDPYRISVAKGATALADYQANKTITIDYATNELFIRAKGTGRSAGSYQADAFQGHRHNAQGSTAAGGSNSYVPPAGTIGGTTTLSVLDPISDGVNGTPRTASETRSKNVALYAYIRYSGDTVLTVAQISGLESCSSTVQCTDDYKATVTGATGAIVSQNVPNALTVTRTATGIFSIGYSSLALTTPPAVQIFSNCAQNFVNTPATTTAIVIQLRNSSGVDSDCNFNVLVSRLGGDSIPKSARAVASDQNNRTTGAINVENFTVTYGTTNASTICSATPCSYVDQIGSVVSSITRSSAGSYVLNLSKTYSKLKCSLTAYGSGASASPYNTGGGLSCSSCNSMAFGTVRTSTEGFIDTFGSLYCQGQN